MSQLRLSLLGQVSIFKEDTPLVGFKSSKAVALLCYLAVSGETSARSTLVNLLWSELPEDNARMNLRKVLTNLRTLAGTHLRITRYTVAFNRESTYWLDVEEFEAILHNAAEAHGNGQDAQRTIQQLQAAVGLYRGDFLEGLQVRQAPILEEWLGLQQMRLQTLSCHALERLAHLFNEQGDSDRAIETIRRLLVLEPWREQAHRQLMLWLAHHGQLSAALVQYETCRQALAEALDVEPSMETMVLYDRLRSATRAPRLNLPTQTTSFVGRTADLAYIQRHLADPTCRCITLVGPGGIGKTRLALEAAATSSHGFLHGVNFVSLTAIHQHRLIASTIANALQLPLDGQEEPAVQLLHYLQEQELLLVLDNLEHLPAGRQFLVEILAKAPRVKILATSRERLNLKAEWVVEVSGLELPTQPPARPLQEYSAVRLFLQTARRVQAKFVITDANSQAIVRICRFVEGMPLGIELAAAWVRTLSCDEIAHALEQNFELLTTTQPDVPERHRSMEAVLAESWRLLTAIQQQVFQKLSVFRGGFRWEAVQEILGVSIQELAALRDKSLLQRDEGGRYTLHELMRLFAHGKLSAARLDAAAAMYGRHCRYYLGWLASQEAHLYGQHPQVAVESVQTEIDNVRRAWHWATVHGEWQVLGQCLQAWTRFYHLRGIYTEAESWLNDALVQVQTQQEEQIEVDPALHRLQGHLLLHIADVLVVQAKYRQALDYVEEADDLAACWNDPDLKARPLALRGFIHQFQREHAVALVYQQQAHDLLLPSGERRLLAHLLLQMGKTYEQMHSWEQALTLQREALQLFQELGDSWGIATSWGAMGSVHFGAGNLDQALHDNRHALEMAQQMNAQPEIVHYIAAIAKVYWRTGHVEDALQHFNRALALAAELGLAHRLGEYHRIVGIIYTGMGQFNQASIHLERAVHLAQKGGAIAEQVAALAALGFLQDAEGNYLSAFEQYRSAQQLAEQVGEPRLVAISAGRLGFAYAQLGQFPQARELLEQAVADLQALGSGPNVPALALHLRHLASVLYQQGEHAAAELHCRAALQLIHESEQTMFMSQRIALWTMLMLARCRHAQGYDDEAIQQVVGLLHIAPAPKERVLVLETLWQLTQERSYIEDALVLYRELPASIYQKRIEALEQVLASTGQEYLGVQSQGVMERIL